MTFIPQLIDNITPADNLKSGANKINQNFLNLASLINNIELAVSVVAGENISQYQLVYALDGFYYIATNKSSETEAFVVGIAQEDIASGQSGLIQVGQSIITNPSWNFSQSVPVFLGEDGSVTMTPSGASYLIQVGFALLPSTIFFNTQRGFVLDIDAGEI